MKLRIEIHTDSIDFINEIVHSLNLDDETTTENYYKVYRNDTGEEI